MHDLTGEIKIGLQHIEAKITPFGKQFDIFLEH
jgi:hypothetical protein